MKSSYIISAVIFAATTIIAPGCTKILDVKPKSQITGQNFFTSEGDFEVYVTGIYTTLRSIANSDLYAAQRSEEYANGPNARLNSAVYNQLLSPSNGAADWQLWYSGIGNCNLLLDKIQAFSFSGAPDTKKRILGETYALRAWFFFHLTRVFGKVPLMLQAITDDNVPLLARSSEADVMIQIQADLDASIQSYTTMTNFSKTAFPSGKYRFSYASVQALKADTKLWSAKVLAGGAADLAAAVTALTEVEACGATLNADFKNVITLRAASNPEDIMAAYFIRDETGNNFTVNYLAIASQVTGVLNADSIPSSISPSYGQGGYFMSSRSKALFSSGDKRIPFTYVTERVAAGYNNNNWIVKFPGTKYADDRIPDNDLPLYRLADIFLMKAEAYAGQNQTAQAIAYLQKIRDRAGTGTYSGATDQLSVETEILNERGRELYGENKRWFDLIRFYKGGTINLYTFVPNLAGKTIPVYWPISVTTLAKNNQLKQTEGY